MAIISLTPQSHKNTAASDSSEAAGATAIPGRFASLTEISSLPAISDWGSEFSSETYLRLESVFRYWWAENHNVLELGGSGDLVGLRDTLNAALIRRAPGMRGAA